MQYKDVTDEYIKNAAPNNHKIKFNDKTFIDNKTNKEYIVDGKHVKFEPSEKEKEVAKWLEKTLGGKVEVNPKILEPPDIKIPDYYYNGLRLDLKEIKGNGKNTIDTAVKSKKEQADNFIIDITDNCNLDNNEIFKQIERLYGSKNRKWVNTIILRRNEKLLKVYIRI